MALAFASFRPLLSLLEGSMGSGQFRARELLDRGCVCPSALGQALCVLLSLVGVLPHLGKAPNYSPLPVRWMIALPSYPFSLMG